ncbi:hypothetical protein SNE40_021874 [Patella caerulea]|uniref:N-acetyltransferase domain-containing protein n=1 Tax=Patella caerulea TaxID=87958 RepID=A0AAN8IX95_PATCE
MWPKSLKPGVLTFLGISQMPILQRFSRNIPNSISTISRGIQNVDHQPSNNRKLQQAVRVPHRVPFVTTLPDGDEVVIDFMTDGQISEVYAMIQEDAENGVGYGINEYPSENAFRLEIKGGSPFAVRKKDSDKLVAGFIITSSSFYRGTEVADALGIVHKSERRKGIGDFCMQICENFAIDLGFVAIYADCFSNNKAMLRSIERIGGYIRCGYLPMGGQMSNGTYVSSILFYKDLRHSMNTEPRVSCHCLLED